MSRIHFVKNRREHREQYTNFILPTLQNPYEIWATKYSDGKIRPNYIGIYKGDNEFLTIIREALDGSLIFELTTFFDANKINNNRNGLLIYKK